MFHTYYIMSYTLYYLLTPNVIHVLRTRSSQVGVYVPVFRKRTAAHGMDHYSLWYYDFVGKVETHLLAGSRLQYTGLLNSSTSRHVYNHSIPTVGWFISCCWPQQHVGELVRDTRKRRSSQQELCNSGEGTNEGMEGSSERSKKQWHETLQQQRTKWDVVGNCCLQYRLLSMTLEHRR